MKNYIKLMRPKHYLKNFLIFIPLIFSGLALESKILFSNIFAFLAFCLTASVVYIVNDILDKEKDKLHEKKKNRPIASGKVKVLNAVVLAIILFIMSFILNCIAVDGIDFNSYNYILIYIIINLTYSFGLKNIPLIDVTILVAGFLIRVIYGACITGVDVSSWLYLTVISISFYLGLGKRRNEIIKSGTKTRDVLKHYNQEFLDKNMYMYLAITIVFYSLWCVDPVNTAKFGNLIIWTVPLVILICMKYSMNIENDSYGDPVEVVFDDKILLSLIMLYGIIIMALLYIPKII